MAWYDDDENVGAEISGMLSGSEQAALNEFNSPSGTKVNEGYDPGPGGFIPSSSGSIAGGASSKSTDPWAGHVASSRDSYLGSPGGGSSRANVVGKIPTLTDIDLPKYEALTYKAPEYDESKVQSLADKNAMAGRSQLRRGLLGGVNQVSGMSDSPVVQKFALGKAYESFGDSIAKNESAAEAAGRAEYNDIHRSDVDAAKTQFTADANKAQSDYQADYASTMAKYQASLNAWLAGNGNTLTGEGTDDTNQIGRVGGINYSYHR